MKFKTISLLVAASIALLFSGCGALDKAYDQQAVVTPPQTNYVTINVTNVVNVPPTATVPAHQEIQVTPTITATIKPAVTNFVLIDKPIVTSGLEVGKSLPIPYVGLGAAIIGLAYSTYRNIRNKKINVALIQGIEGGRALLQTPELRKYDDAIKAQLTKHQELAGVLNEVSALVNDHTTTTTPPR